MGKPLIDLTGRKFGKLTVLHKSTQKSKNGARWICECECGNIVDVRGNSLRQGVTKSCGCIHKSMLSDMRKTHGMSGTRIYGIWQAMIKRCHKPNFERYEDYGGRGISVCDEWRHDFQAFYDWALENGYRDDLTLDREDFNGNYEPSNCRWVTYKVQGNNTRRNHLITFNGETHTLAQWSEITGIKYITLAQRINAYGWPIEKALTEPVKRSV